MAQQYRYYVFVCAGQIAYFNDRREAEAFAAFNDSEVSDMDI